MINAIRVGLAAAALVVCGPLRAGDAGWSVGVAGNVVTDSIQGLAKSYGATVDAAYTWHSESAGLPLRATFSYAYFPAPGYTGINGTAPSTYKIGLQDLQVGLDGFATLPSKNLKLFFGFTLNKWRVNADSTYFIPDVSPTGEPLPTGTYQSGSASGPVPGIKLGVHIGLERPFTDHLTGFAEFQATALGTTSVFMVPSDPNYSQTSGNGGVNPCWLQLGVRYHF